MLDNLGETKSHGIDISINGDVFRTKNFTWSLGANFSQYANEIVKIDNQVDENGKPLSQPGNSWFVGIPIHVYYDYLRTVSISMKISISNEMLMANWNIH